MCWLKRWEGAGFVSTNQRKAGGEEERICFENQTKQCQLDAAGLRSLSDSKQPLIKSDAVEREQWRH